MKMESGLKHFSPQGMLINDDTKSTSPDRLNGTDIMYAFGATSSRARFGLAAYLGKTGLSQSDGKHAIQSLASYALDIAPKNVRKAAGDQFGNCMLILARFAFAQYSHSADAEADCLKCSGTGFIEAPEDVVTYPGLFNMAGEELVARRTKPEMVKRLCSSCGGKGKLKARCRCGGSGLVRDRKVESEDGKPVFKKCGRCSGEGVTSIPSTQAHKAILKYVPALHVRTWTRNWKPFYESLVEVCNAGERNAAKEFERVTR